MFKREIAILITMLAVVGLAPTSTWADNKKDTMTIRSQESVRDAGEKMKEALHAVVDDEMDEERHHRHHRHISKD